MDALNLFLNDINAAWTTGNTLVKTLLAIVTTMLVFYLLRYVVVRKLEKLTALTDNDFDDRFVHFLRQFLWLAVLFMGLVWVLQINGIKVGPVLAGAGIFGIAIGLRRTTIRNTDGVIVNYPNAVLASSTVKNFSMDPQPMRVRIRFQTDFSADPLQVKAVTLKMIDQVDGIIPGSGTVVIRSIWDDEQGHMLSGVLYEARYRLEDVKRRTVIRSEVLERLISAFKAEEIPMAAVPIRKV